MIDDDEDLITSIYEAAAVPEQWVGVLEKLRHYAGAKATALVSFDEQGSLRHINTPAYSEPFDAFMRTGLELENARPRRYLERRLTGFVTDLEVCTEDELRNDPIYQRYLRPYGFAWTAGMVIPYPTNDTVIFDLAAGSEAGPFTRATMERLDVFRPHLARAAILAHRLGMRTATSQTAALQAVGLPSAVFGEGGKIIASNQLFEQLEPRLKSGPGERLQLPTPHTARLFRDALAACLEPDAPATLSIPLPAHEQGMPLVLHVVPTRRQARDIFSSSVALVVVTPVTMPKAPLRDVLSGLFDLTPAEARVASAVSRGQSLSELAKTEGLSKDTLRNQLKSVMAKTGTSRQLELALLLNGSQLPSKRTAS